MQSAKNFITELD